VPPARVQPFAALLGAGVRGDAGLRDLEKVAQGARRRAGRLRCPTCPRGGKEDEDGWRWTREPAKKSWGGGATTGRAQTPYIRVAWDSWLDAKWDMPTRVIFDYEFMCLRGGELDVVVEGEHYHAVPGDIVIFRPRQRHALHVIGTAPIHQPHIHCDLVT